MHCRSYSVRCSFHLLLPRPWLGHPVLRESVVELDSGGSDRTSLALPSAQLPGAAVLEAWPGLVPGPQSLHLGWMLQGRVQAGLHFLALSGAVLWLKAECHLASGDQGESQGEGRQREESTQTQ